MVVITYVYIFPTEYRQIKGLVQDDVQTDPQAK